MVFHVFKTQQNAPIKIQQTVHKTHFISSANCSCFGTKVPSSCSLTAIKFHRSNKYVRRLSPSLPTQSLTMLKLQTTVQQYLYTLQQQQSPLLQSQLFILPGCDSTCTHCSNSSLHCHTVTAVYNSWLCTF
jgi:hypothetical protein